MPIGALDGVNVLFDTSATYEPLTVFIYRNGQLQPKEFVIELGGTRFEVCDRLLRDPERSLGEIAFALGYSDQAHLTRAFRRWTGECPSEYRQRQH